MICGSHAIPGLLASLRCSALPHDAERLWPPLPLLLLPRVSSAQELGVFREQEEKSAVNTE